MGITAPPTPDNRTGVVGEIAMPSSTPGVGVGEMGVGVAVGPAGGMVGVAVGEPLVVGVGDAPPGEVVGVGVGVSLATGALVGARPLCVVGGALTLVVLVVPLVVVALVVLPVVGVWVGVGAPVVGVTVTL